ncbi:hypothetical protein [Hyphomicrobium denitrificans]|nr:hypothetical protein [Hyphomicrobium denitrificans]
MRISITNQARAATTYSKVPTGLSWMAACAAMTKRVTVSISLDLD